MWMVPIPVRCLMPTWIPISRLTVCSIKRLYSTGKVHNIQLLVREDTVAGKVYFKSWDPPGNMIGNGAYLMDTAEFVAYNFGLNVGDTMIMPFVYGGYGTAISMHILIQKDSVKINDVWHIAQRFKCPLGFGSSWSEYDVVEGVGSLTNPVNPAPFFNFENTQKLYCFGNGDTLSPSSITLPFSPSQGYNGFRTVFVFFLQKAGYR